MASEVREAPATQRYRQVARDLEDRAQYEQAAIRFDLADLADLAEKVEVLERIVIGDARRDDSEIG